MKNIIVSDIMTRNVITIHEDEVISNFINLISDKGINGMPVVNSNNELIGIATKTDLLVFEIKRELSSIYENKLEDVFNEYNDEGNWNSFSDMIHKYNSTITVRDIMVENVLTVHESTSVQEICKIMKEKKLNHIVVMEDNTIKGIVTSRDIISLFADGGC